MNGLNRGDNPQACKSVHIRWRKMLRVLDSRAVIPGGKRRLVDGVEYDCIGLVTDGVGINLPAMGIRPVHDVDQAVFIKGLNA